MDLVTTISYLFKDVAAVVSLLMIMHYVFLDRFKFKPIKTILVFAVIIANAFIGIFVLTKAYQDTADLMDFVSNVICILSVRLLTEQKRIVKIIWITMLYLMTVEMVFSLVSPYIYKKLFVEYFITGIMFSLVGMFIYVFSVKTRYNLLPKVFDEIPRWVFVAVLLFDLSCYYKEFGISEDWYNFFYTVSSIMVICCVLYLLFKVFNMSYQQNHDKLKRISHNHQMYNYLKEIIIMKKFVCTVCGYVHEGDAAPANCPVCKVPAEKFNEQKDEGPAENINSYLNQINQPEMIFISIGATRYTDFGEHNYLKKGDKTIILLYPHSEFSENDILELVKTNNFSDKRISVLNNVIK